MIGDSRIQEFTDCDWKKAGKLYVNGGSFAKK